MDFNLAFYLSLILAASSCFGLLLAGRGKWQGWAVGLATQPVWAWFAIVTKSYGLLLVGVMYTSVYIKNLLTWRKDQKQYNRVRAEFEHKHNEPIGQITSVVETDEGLQVKGKLYDDFQMPVIGPWYPSSVSTAVGTETLTYQHLDETEFNYNRHAGSSYFQSDYQAWQRDRGVNGKTTEGK